MTIYFPKSLCLALVFAPLIIFTGCQRQIHITNNAFADIDAIPHGFGRYSSFLFLPVIIKDSGNNALFAKEIARKAATILEDRGCLVEYDDHADYYIQITVSCTEQTYTINIPKYIPGETEYTEGSVDGNRDSVNYQETKQKTGTTIYVQEERTEFRKNLEIEVFKTRHYHHAKRNAPVWQGSAITCDENNDLRESIDYLLITALRHFGKNTPKKVITTIGSNDKEVERLRISYCAA